MRQCHSLFLWLNVWQSLLTALRKDQFSSVTFNQQVSFPVWTKHADVSNTSVVTHCFFRHSSGHVVHVVVFYQRGDEQFLWHSSLPDVQHIGLKTASIQFGRHEGAYNRWINYDSTDAWSTFAVSWIVYCLATIVYFTCYTKKLGF